MPSFGLPDKSLLSSQVQGYLPSWYDGISTEPELVTIFERFTDKHTISDKLKDFVHPHSEIHTFFEGLAETFPETGANSGDYWTLEISDLKSMLSWFLVYQTCGAICDNGLYVSIKDTLAVHRKVIDPEGHLNLEILSEAIRFISYIKDEGSYVSLAQVYPLLFHNEREEALKILASGMTLEKYYSYCELGCYTYDEIFKGHVAELPDAWREFLLSSIEKKG